MDHKTSRREAGKVAPMVPKQVPLAAAAGPWAWTLAAANQLRRAFRRRHGMWNRGSQHGVHPQPETISGTLIRAMFGHARLQCPYYDRCRAFVGEPGVAQSATLRILEFPGLLTPER